jgi:L-asparaginase
MAYFSSALSFSLQQLWKPVVLTWAQIPLNVISSDGRNNFINALRVATMNLCGVFLVFGTKIICGCRATKVGESELEAFESYHTHPYWSIWIWIRLNEENITCTQDSLILKNWFSENIMSINMFPGIKNSHLMHLLDAGIAWFILKGYGTWDVPDYIFPFLREAQKRNIPIVQATQCRWTTILGIYSIWKEALACWVIEAYDMSLEAITTKLMRSLHQQLSYEQIKSSMHTNIAGELDTTKALFYKD